MKKFVRRSKGDAKGSPRGKPKGNSSGRGRKSFSDKPKGKSKFAGRESKRGSKNRRDGGMTQVTCSACKKKCGVPFKPTSNKPVYCDDCFSKQDQGSPKQTSNKDLEMINRKLDKIMKALKI